MTVNTCDGCKAAVISDHVPSTYIYSLAVPVLPIMNVNISSRYTIVVSEKDIDKIQSASTVLVSLLVYCSNITNSTVSNHSSVQNYIRTKQVLELMLTFTLSVPFQLIASFARTRIRSLTVGAQLWAWVAFTLINICWWMKTRSSIILLAVMKSKCTYRNIISGQSVWIHFCIHTERNHLCYGRYGNKDCWSTHPHLQCKSKGDQLHMKPQYEVHYHA